MSDLDRFPCLTKGLSMNRKLLAAALAVALSSCETIPVQPADPAVTQRIVTACLASGLFKTGVGFGLSFAGPPGEIADRVISWGIDKVCADPARYAADAATVEWVVKNLAAVLRR